MDPFITHTGRAVPSRRPVAAAGLYLPAAQGAYAGATILISGADLPSGPARARTARALADYGFRAVISGRFADILYDDMIQAGIVPAQLPVHAVDNLLRAIEADPGILLEVDLARRTVSARGEPCTAFQIDEYARQALMAGTDVLADRLRAAQRDLDSCGLRADLRIRLQRRLMAICDAMKAPGADPHRGKRRLEKFLEELDRRL